MKLTGEISKHNFVALLWHAGFLAFAKNFMDVDTVIPAMLVDAGGSAVQIGIMSAIMLGGSSFTQLIFAPFVSNHHFKKKFLLLGINSRILALFGMGILLFFPSLIKSSNLVWLIFILITIFSLGGAFANVSYTDILGKSVLKDSRKSFFSIKQVVTGVILLFSALIAKKVLTAFDYPTNYGYMFFIAFGSLFIASLGFWNIKEVIQSKLTVRGPKHFFHLIRTEIRQNPRLKFFLGFINTMGVSLTLLPFVILYAKEHQVFDSSDTGIFLLFKVVGSVVTGFILFLLAGKYKYRYLLYGSATLALLVSISLLLQIEIPSLAIIFFIGGIMYTGYSISMNGVLLEVSGVKNRTLYTGIAGAGNILPAIFPLFSGWLIKHYGFQPFFIVFIVIILTSLFFIYKLNCRK
jgi:MFS family permease